jgi:hypothetical protein
MTCTIFSTTEAANEYGKIALSVGIWQYTEPIVTVQVEAASWQLIVGWWLRHCAAIDAKHRACLSGSSGRHGCRLENGIFVLDWSTEF